MSLQVKPLLRPSWLEVDLAAIRHNVATLRAACQESTRFFAVCKHDGYGLGAGQVARAAIEGGADALAVANPDDAIAIRAAGVTEPILLYGSTLPRDAADVLAIGVIPTVFDLEGAQAYAQAREGTKVFVKVDTGMTRLGFRWASVSSWLPHLLAIPGLRVYGIYTHIASPQDPEALQEQGSRLLEVVRAFEVAGCRPNLVMAASSLVFLTDPRWQLTAINCGRAMYGLVDGPLARKLPLRCALSAVRTHLIQVKEIPRGAMVGYSRDFIAPRPMRIGVAPFGWGDSCPRGLQGAEVLVGGRRALVVAASIEHVIIDVTEVPAATVANEVVVVGRQGGEAITLEEWHRRTRQQLVELSVMFGRLPRRYVDAMVFSATNAE